jgi:hypothetical protein
VVRIRRLSTPLVLSLDLSPSITRCAPAAINLLKSIMRDTTKLLFRKFLGREAPGNNGGKCPTFVHLYNYTSTIVSKYNFLRRTAPGSAATAPARTTLLLRNFIYEIINVASVVVAGLFYFPESIFFNTPTTLLLRNFLNRETPGNDV